MLQWDEADGVELLRWTAAPGVVGAFSTRKGGVSEGRYASLNLGVFSGDDVARVLENRARLLAAVGAEGSRTSSCRQIHSATVHRAPPLAPEDGFLTGRASPPEGDGLVTDEPERALVTFSADCVPVLLARADGSAVAACHAGWRGLIAGVVEEAARALGPGPLVAAVGPCAGPERYEVGPEVAAPLVARFGEGVMRGRLADLPACTVRALVDAGVDPAAIDVAGHCTIGEPERFFSHRRGEDAGRQCGIVLVQAA